MLEVLHYIHHYQASHLGAEGSAGNLISSGVVTLKITPRNLLNSPKKTFKNALTIELFFSADARNKAATFPLLFDLWVQ